MKSKVLPVLLVLILVVSIGYYRIEAASLSPRGAVESGLANAKALKKLSPSEEGLLKIQIAVADYVARKGAPPGTLSELIPEYFDEVPTDPSLKEPYQYNRSGNRYEIRPPGVEMPEIKTREEKGSSAEGRKVDGVSEQKKTLTEKELQEALKAEESWVYDPSGKRDPFRPFDMTAKDDPNDKRTPLERFDIGQLRLTATATDSKGEPTAMVEDETGHGYTVRVGTKIGSNNGQVISITQDMMRIVQRKLEAFTGVESETFVEMKIQKDIELKKKGKGAKKKKR